jgi:hypothetical protein
MWNRRSGIALVSLCHSRLLAVSPTREPAARAVSFAKTPGKFGLPESLTRLDNANYARIAIINGYHFRRVPGFANDIRVAECYANNEAFRLGNPVVWVAGSRSPVNCT